MNEMLVQLQQGKQYKYIIIEDGADGYEIIEEHFRAEPLEWLRQLHSKNWFTCEHLWQLIELLVNGAQR